MGPVKRLSISIEVDRSAGEYEGNPTFRVIMLVWLLRCLAMVMGVVAILAGGVSHSGMGMVAVLMGFALAALACIPVHVVENQS